MGLAAGFVGARLADARRARGISSTEFAKMTDLSVQSISKYENGKQTPRHEIVSRFCTVLSFSKPYFFRAKPPVDEKPVFWRSKLSAQVSSLDRAVVRLEWFKEVVEYLETFFDFPQLDLPDLDVPENPQDISSDFLEFAADQLRTYWNVARGPMPDSLEKIEESGILVSRIHVNAEKVDAFSQWSDSYGIPFIVLSRDKASAARQRFDALHELAHILLHKRVQKQQLENKVTYKLLEKQADIFASFVLLPERDFLDELYAPTLDGMLSLKERWGVSVAAMIMRCTSLGLLDDAASRRMWMNYTRRGWRKGEPFDGKMEKESPHLIRRSFELLIEEGVQSPADITSALPLPIDDLEELADLPSGILGSTSKLRAGPTLKTSFSNSSDNVVQLFGKSK